MRRQICRLPILFPQKFTFMPLNLFSWTFPVNINTQNSLAEHLSLQRMSITPSKVRVLIGSNIKPEQIKIETEPIDLQKIFFTTTLDTKIVLPAGVSFPDGKSPYARVIIKVKKKASPVSSEVNMRSKFQKRSKKQAFLPAV